MQMKPIRFTSLLAAAALCAVPAFAQVPAGGGEEAPALPPALPDSGVRGPVLPRIMPSGPKFDSLSPAEREHIRRMAEFRAARDAAEQDIIRLRQKVEDRRSAILAENEEAKTLFEDAQRLFAECASKTNALQAILESDETISALFEEMKPAKTLVESNQRALNAEAVAAMQRRMREQREKAEAEGSIPPPTIDRIPVSGEKSAPLPAPAEKPVLSETETK